MANLRDILAQNLREYRRKNGLSQAKLAEKAGISTQYIAMIELSRQFPTPEVLDQIAGALEIKSYQLFTVPPSSEDTIEQLRQILVSDIRQTVEKAVENAFMKRDKSNSTA